MAQAWAMSQKIVAPANEPAITNQPTFMQRILKSFLPLTICLALLISLAARAEDKKPEITGTWKSSFTNQNGQVRESVFKLKAEGEKLTGTVSGRNNDTAIEEGKIKGEEISVA